MGDFLGESHVGLGFAEDDRVMAVQLLTDAGIKIVPSEEEGQSA